MKKIRRFLSLSIFCIMFLTTISFAEKINTAEVDVFFEIQTVGYESAYVDATEDDITIKINIDSSDFISDLDQIFIIAYNKIDVNEYNIEIFLEDNKIFTITAPREVINSYISGQINEELFLDTLTYQDERSREEKLKIDLEVLDMIVYGVKLNQNRCEVLLYYTGHDVAELIEDIPNMHLLVIEHAPWVEKTVFIIENHREAEYMRVELQTQHIIQLFEGTINHEEYYESANISVEKMVDGNSLFNNIESLLGGIKNMSILDILIILLFVGFAVFGYMKGFVGILIGFTSYILAIIGARIFAPKVVEFLTTKTTIVNRIDAFVVQRFNALGIDMNLLNTELPKLDQLIAQNPEVREAMAQNPMLIDIIEKSGDFLSNSQSMLNMLTNTILTVISMFVLFIILKITISFLGKMFFQRKKERKKSKADRILGAAFGIITSVFISALCVYLITTVSFIVPNTFITGLIQDSFMVKALLLLIGLF